MKNLKKGSADVKNSNVGTLVAEETTKRVNGKINTNVNQVSNTSLSIDEEESESPKKKATFDKVRELFGFTSFDGNSDYTRNLAADFAAGKLSFEEFTKKVSESRKAINATNEEKENISFEAIITKIQESDLISDFSQFVGTSDLKTLKDRLLTDNGKKVVLFHGKQSDDESKPFESYKVSIKGLHKPYSDICYVSSADYCTSNVIRAFRNYGYYLSSLKRCIRQKKVETNLVKLFGDCVARLHDEFGYMPEDFAKLLK